MHPPLHVHKHKHCKKVITPSAHRPGRGSACRIIVTRPVPASVPDAQLEDTKPEDEHLYDVVQCRKSRL